MSFLLFSQEVLATEVTIWVGAVNENIDDGVLSLEVNGVDSIVLTVLGIWESKTRKNKIFYKRQKIKDLTPNTHYKVELKKDGNVLADCTFDTLPITLPKSFLSPFRVFIGSCFYINNDKGVEKKYLALDNEPNIKILSGDQVYLDNPHKLEEIKKSLDDVKTLLPTLLTNLEDELFEKYLKNWTPKSTGGGFGGLLKKGANYFASDDHEYWNNAPLGSFIAPETLLANGREKRLAISKELYKIFQTEKSIFSFNVGILSFFVADTRLNRDKEFSNFMLSEDFSLLENWISNLNGPGVLVLSQPLFDEDTTIDSVLDRIESLEQEHGNNPNIGIWHVIKPLKELLVKIKNGPSVLRHAFEGVLNKALKELDEDVIAVLIDSSLKHFEQYNHLLQAISKSKHSIVVLTGDIHYSRISKCVLDSGTEIIEIVSSPMALVSDKAKGSGLPAKSKFAHNLSGAVKGNVSTITDHLTKNSFDPSEDHFTTLEFYENLNNQVEMQVKIWPINQVGFIPVLSTFILR